MIPTAATILYLVPLVDPFSILLLIFSEPETGGVL